MSRIILSTIIGFIVLIGLLVLYGYLYVNTLWQNLSLKFKFKGLNTNNFDLSSLLGMGTADTSLLMSAVITNNNDASIVFKNLKVWLYYEQTLIAETTSQLEASIFEVTGKLTYPSATNPLEVSDSINLHINSATIKLLKNVVLPNGNSNVHYVVKGKIVRFGFSIPVTYEGDFNFKESVAI